ncbi:MAG: GNAT family N-acetyltransferase [Planctomycetota bacterium]
MTTTYFRRYCMQIDLRNGWTPRSLSPLPPGFELWPWKESLREAHARAKYESFREEMDTNIFSCLGNEEGCRRLMRDISFRDGFLPEATWLLVHHSAERKTGVPCGTIQAIRTGPRVASIQNVGVSPAFRGRGLGSWLVNHSLQGMHRSQFEFGQLEVTASNLGAIRLYERLGFHRLKVVHKSTDVRSFPSPL